MNVDTELEAWRAEWRGQTVSLPELKRKIRRQNTRTIAAISAIGVLLIAAAIVAPLYHSSLVAGFAVGLAFASLTLGAYAWRARRGAWRPTAQTTLAYAELAHNRAIAKGRTLRAASYLLGATSLAGAALIAWYWKTIHVRDVVILAALVAEIFYLKSCERRQKREVEESRKLVDDLTRNPAE